MRLQPLSKVSLVACKRGGAVVSVMLRSILCRGLLSLKGETITLARSWRGHEQARTCALSQTGSTDRSFQHWSCTFYNKIYVRTTFFLGKRVLVQPCFFSSNLACTGCQRVSQFTFTCQFALPLDSA